MGNKSWCKCDHCLKEGLVAFQEGRWCDVLFEYDSLLIESVREVHPDNCTAWNRMVYWHYKIGDSPITLRQHFDSFERDDFNSKRTWLNTAYLLAERGRPEEALKCLERALELDPAYTDAIELKNLIMRDLSLCYQIERKQAD